MRSTSACLLAAATLAACTVPGTPAGQANPKPKASTPTTAASAGAKAPPPQLLQKPAGASTELSGTLRIDASYAYNGGLGKLITNDGGSLITNDGAGLIGNDGAGLIGNDGASLVITSGNLISQDGGGLITNDGAGIVAQGAGNLISKRKYALDGTGAAVKMAVGTLLRAANMEIQVTDTATGEPLALGEDGAKGKVYAITTNAAGAFKVYLPAGVDSQTVRISATAGGLADDRLALQVLVPNAASVTDDIDPDRALVTRYLRGTFGARIDQTFGDADGKGGSFLDLVPDGSALALLVAPIGEKIGQAALAAGTAKYNKAQRHQMGLLCADAIMSTLRLEDIQTLDGSRMMGQMLDVLRDFRAAADLKMRSLGAPDPVRGYFTDASWFQKANAARAARCEPPYVILTASDLGELILNEILTSASHKQQFTIYEVFDSIGFPKENGQKLNNALVGFYGAVFTKLQPADDGEDSPAMQRLLGAIAKPPAAAADAKCP